MKPKIVIFEGVDKSGKSTLIKAFNKQTNYKYWVWDRSIISSIVYDILFNRLRNNEQIKILKILKKHFDLKIIYCTVDDDIIQERLEKSNEELPLELKNIPKVKEQFVEIFMRYNLNFVFIDTSIDIEQCLRQIKEFIEK